MEELKEIKVGIKGMEKEKIKKEELEKRYGIMKGIPEQEVEKIEEKKPKEVEKIESVPEILMKVERLDGRVSAMEEIRKVMDERISQMAEEIGELRSTFLGMDKRFVSLETRAEKAVRAVEEISPEKTRSEFKKVEKDMMEIRAEIERIQTTLDSMKKEESELRNLLGKIKNLENLMDISRRIEEKISKIDEATIHADRTAAKVEVVFSELGEKLGEIERQKGRIERTEELTKELVKMLDEISLKIPKFAEKSEIEKLSEEAVKKFVSTETSKIGQELGKVKEFLTGIEEIKNRIKELEKINKEKAQPEDIKSIIVRQEKLSKEMEELKKFVIKERTESTEIKTKEMEEKISKISESVKKLAEVLSTRLEALEKFYRKTEIYFEILQLVSILPYLSRIEEINAYLKLIRERVDLARNIGIERGIEEFLSNILIGISNTWKFYRQDVLAEIFRKEAAIYLEREKPS